MRKVLGSLATLCVISVSTAVLLEGAYRIYLAQTVAAELEKRVRAIKRPDEPGFRVWATAPWRFDRELGFSYTKGPWPEALIRGREFDACDIFARGDAFGNIDREPNNYFSADIRLMIVGSSFSMIRDGKERLVNEVIMDDLTERLGRSVSVVNFSRDATGVLSYIDAAAVKASELKPDAVILLANTVSLNYRRHWRVVLPDRDGFSRLWFLLDPIEHPTELNSSRMVAQTPFVYSRITDSWCSQLTAAKQRGDSRVLTDDPLVKAMVAEHDRIADTIARPRVTVDFWRHDVSFVFNVLLSGDPFNGVPIFGEQPVYSPITFDRYEEDPQFVTALARLKASKIPIIPVHLPTLPEMLNFDGDFDSVGNRTSLVADLEQALGQRFVNLYRYYPDQLKSSPQQLFKSGVDFHPSPVGVDAMAAAIEKMLLEHEATADLFRNSTVHSDASVPKAAILRPQTTE